MHEAIRKLVTDAIMDAVRESEPMGAPGGLLYMACMTLNMDLDTFQAIMDTMVQAGQLRVSGYVYHVAEMPAEC